MKKDILKKSVCGVVLGFTLAVGAGFVNAELNGTSKTVKVGSVETTIYSYEIDMDEFGIYDWVYNNETEKFEWANGCKAYTYEAGIGSTEGMYSDSKCSTSVSDLSVGDTYYARVSNQIIITDNSTYGKISADVEYVPSNNYKWTGMEIDINEYACNEVPANEFSNETDFSLEYYYKDSECSESFPGMGTFVVGVDKAYKYYDNTFTNEAHNLTTTEYDSYPTSYSSVLIFNEAGTYNFPYNNGISNNSITLNIRTAKAEFFPHIVKLKNTDDEALANPVAGDTLGTVTVNIHESFN